MNTNLLELSNSNKLDDQFSNFSKNTVFTKDGVEVEKHSNKYIGHIFYDEVGNGYECLGYSPKLQDCVYRNVNTGIPVVGCVTGFYYNDPTKKALINNKLSELSNANKLDEEFSSYDASEHCGCGQYKVGCRATCAKNKLADAVEKAARDIKAAKDKLDAKVKKDLKDAFDKAKALKDKVDAKVKKDLKDAGKSIKATKKKMDDKVKKDFKKLISKLDQGQLLNKFNKVNPAMMAIRGAVISMLQINLLGIATGFGHMKDKSSPQWEKIKDKWYLIGGDPNKLNSNVDRGKTKKELLKAAVMKLMPKKHSFSGEYSNAGGGENIGTAVAVSAVLLGVATPILASMTPAGTVPAGWTGAGAAFLGAVSPMMKKFGQENGADPNALADIPPPTGIFPPELTDKDLDRVRLDANGNPMLDKDGYPIIEGDTIWGFTKPVFWTGAAVLGVTAALLILWGTGVFDKKTVKQLA